MRRQLSLIACLLFPLLLQAEGISREQAAQIATHFLSTHGGGARARAVAGGVDSRQLTALEPSGRGSVGDALLERLHIFNVSSNGGYVIVSSNDQTQPILGYAHSGQLSLDSLPPHVASFLQGYAEQLDWIESHPQTASERRLPPYGAIQPLLHTTWAQDSPYNYLCPTYNGMVCTTGCMATAVAQIMNYHQHPAQSKRIPAYTTSTYGIKVSAQEPTRIDWANMPNKLNLSTSSRQNTAVATLMLLAGTALTMDYSPYASGAYSPDVAPALTNYFDYDSSTRQITRLFYTIDEWQTTICQELAQGRPVYYSGLSEGGGHAFVIDGYDGDGYFHVNWGWNGDNDGYYQLEILDPRDYSGVGAGTGGTGFSREQVAVIGIQPRQGSSSSSEPSRLTVRRMAVQGRNTYSRMGNAAFSGITIGTSMYNEGTTTQTFEMGLGVFNESGDCLTTVSADRRSLDPQTGMVLTIDKLSFGRGWSDGTYTIKAISRVSGQQQWLVNTGSNKYAIEAIISGSQLTLTPYGGNLSGSLSIDGTLGMGKEVSVEAWLQNSGKDFSNYLFLFVGGTLINGRVFELGAGESGTFTTRCVLPLSGQQTVKLCTDELGENVVAQTTVNIAEAPEANLTIAATCPDVSDRVLRGPTLKCSLSVTNNLRSTYEEDIIANLFKVTPGSTTASLSQEQRFQASIAGYRTETFNATFTNLEVGAQYLVLVYYMSKAVQTEGCRTNVFKVDEAAIELFTVTGLSLQDQPYYSGVEGQLTVSVRNDGNVDHGTLYAWLDGEKAGTISISSHSAGLERSYGVAIKPRQAGTSTFTISSDASGRETIYSTTIAVEEPQPQFTLTAMELLTEQPEAGQPVDISLTLNNTGLAADGRLYLLVNGKVEETLELSITPWIETTMTVSFTPPSAGTYLVQMATDEQGTHLLDGSVSFTIEPKPGEEPGPGEDPNPGEEPKPGVEVVFSNTEILPPSSGLRVGRTSSFTVITTNTGTLASGPLYALVDDSLVAKVADSVAAGERATMTFSYTPLSAGDGKTLKISTDQAGKLVVSYLYINVDEALPLFNVNYISLDAEQFEVGDTIVGHISVSNMGTTPTTELYLLLADSLVQTMPIEIAPGDTDAHRYPFSFTTAMTGEHLPIRVAADAEGTEVLYATTLSIVEPSAIATPTLAVDATPVAIYNIKGTRVATIAAQELKQFLARLPKGIYLVRTGQGQTLKVRR